MINKRLIGTVPESKKYIAGNVALQWTALVANIGMILAVTRLMQKLYEGTASNKTLAFTALVITCAVAVRFVCTKAATKMGFLSSKSVKSTLRQLIYEKLLRLGLTYKEKASAAEVVQVAVEGVDQLETYFGAYLPQFFYSMLAPLTLFVVLCFINVPAASVLLVCVPLIPITIAAVQTFAKKLLAKYWGEYTTLGDTFLENLQGLTTMKIYQADEFKHQEMNEQSERFRKITMKVLTMQLNSITLMDALAYGGAALGVIMAATQLRSGAVSLGGALAIILLSADFYIPMRLLGSFFHIAMNGMAASEKIFRLLDIAEPNMRGTADFPQDSTIRCENLRFSYEPEREILHGINFSFPAGSFTAIVGESGCGKSTVASILMGCNSDYTGRVTIGGINLKDISEASLMRGMTYVGFDSYLFKGTVRENLRMGAPAATEDALWQVLEQVNLAEFLRSENGLDTRLAEKGSNFSGGQRQRLALARAMLHDSPVYIFDEATSNVDVESENEIMEEIQQLAKTKTVILITHRLANAQGTDVICAMESGIVKEFGTHAELLAKGGVYAQLWNTQQNLEQFAQEAKA
ncbi:ATP-binding cassette domain-containing protein [Pygmaiobacter massiliensis]|uniref:ATP-binding cassette domain-containing protein n=1 Tax=Pygmaiobacter massiliensis TaxID=1917873 RepID=UPI000C7BE180